MTKKEFARIVAFGLVVAAMLVLLCDLFEHKNTYNYDKRFYTYRNLNEDTIDAVYIGGSGTDRFWIAAQAYEEYGMTVYPLSVDALPSWLYINVVEEACAYQDPELFIFDLRGFLQSNTKVSSMDAHARNLLDAMDFFSETRVRAAFKTMEMIHAADENEPAFNVSYLLSFVKFHSQWSEEDYSIKNNLGSVEHKYGGFFMNSSLSTKRTKMENFVYDDTVKKELDPLSEQALYDLIRYIKENDLKVLFVTSPKFMTENATSLMNRVYEILNEEGMEYLDFYERDADGGFTIDFNLKKDFYDEDHVNFYGAKKYTAALAAYIDENFDLPDRRNDDAVQDDWDGVYSRIKKKIKSYEKD